MGVSTGSDVLLTGPPGRARGGVLPWASDLLGLAPLAFALVVLPLMTGGNDPGWLAGAELFTLLVAVWLALTGHVAVPRRGLRSVLAFTLGGLVVAAFWSALFSEDLSASYPMAFEWLWLAVAGLLAFGVCGQRWGREALVGLLLLAAAVQSVWGFYIWLGSRDPRHTQVGTFYAPNQYAGYLILLAPLMLCLCLTARSRLRAAGAGFIAAFVYLAVALSGSRGGVVAAGAGVVALAVLAGRSDPRRVIARGLCFLVTVGALGLLMTGPVFFHGYAKRSGGVQAVLAVKGEDPASLVMRARWDEGAANIGTHHLLTGTGLGTFGPVFARIQNPRWEWSKWAHDQYLEAFAEGGLPLLLGVLALSAVAVFGGLSVVRGIPAHAGPWALGVWAGLVGGAVHLAVDHDWSYAAYGLTFVVMAVLVLGPWELPDPVRPPPRWSLVGTAIALVALLGGLAIAGGFASTHIVGRARPSSVALRLASDVAPYSSAPREAGAERILGQESGASAGNLRDAVRLLREALRLSSLTNRIRAELAGTYAKLDDLPDARRAYAQAIRVAPGDVQSYEVFAEFELNVAKSPQRAAAILTQGLSAIQPGGDAGSIEALVTLQAAVAETVGGPAAGLPYAEQATSVAPSDPGAWLNLLGAACRANDLQTAQTARARALALGATIPAGSC